MEAAAITFGASMVAAILVPMAERAGKEILDHLGKLVHIKTEIRKLQNTLRLIAGFIQDAEEKQIENVHIRDWLRQLVDIGYEAREVLDDFFTSSASIRAKTDLSPGKDSLPSCLPLSCFNNDSSSSTVPVALPFKTKYRLARDVKRVREKLDELMRQNEIVSNLKYVLVINGYGSETLPQRQRPDIGPFVNKQRNLFVGRDGVKEKIMKKVLNHTDNRVHVIPIWGMAGIGKTTLAQSIYRDERLTEQMYPSKNRVWRCVVQQKLDAKGIIMSFVDELNSKSPLEEIQEKLLEKFKEERFIIVLDDVWDADGDQWKLLFDPLTNVDKGGVVILTTRTSQVINATNTVIPKSLQPLSDEDCWSIFKSHAFADGNSRQDLKSIGKQIVAKLKGLPLAAELVGCSLLNEPDAEIWKSFLSSKEWLLINVNKPLMLALKWSYNRLPPHLKQCFRYCSLFPKDHKFDKKLLIEIWMAHDIIQNVGRAGESRRLPEDVGDQYFKELVNASFFQCINRKYVMHDMIHDLALHVSSKEFITVSEGSLPHQMDNYIRHVKIMEDEDHHKNLRLLHTLNKRILTLFLNTDTVYLDVGQAFKQMKSVRVLVLSSTKVTKIPDCIKELKHLRYLDVSKTDVESLPDSVCELYNLQMLYGPLDVVLPKGVVNMTNLRHLRATLRTYKGIGNLTSLQELSRVNVTKGGNIRELGNLRELRGELKIYGLDNVMSSEDAAQAKMQEKTYIEELSLEFGITLERYSIISKDVLEALNCPPNLKSLRIYCFHGNKFPNWLTNPANYSMRSLCSLSIILCHGVDLLQLDAFVSLKRLEVRHCDNLTRIRLAKDVTSSIEDLKIVQCPELMEVDTESLLSSLRELRLNHCGKLSSLRFTLEGLKSLQNLYIIGCPMLNYFFIVE